MLQNANRCCPIYSNIYVYFSNFNTVHPGEASEVILLTLPFFGYCKWFGKMSVCVYTLLKRVSMASFSLPVPFEVWGCLNDSSFQQSKLESLNMSTSKVMKLINVSYETPYS